MLNKSIPVYTSTSEDCEPDDMDSRELVLEKKCVNLEFSYGCLTLSFEYIQKMEKIGQRWVKKKLTTQTWPDDKPTFGRTPVDLQEIDNKDRLCLNFKNPKKTWTIHIPLSYIHILSNHITSKLDKNLPYYLTYDTSVAEKDHIETWEPIKLEDWKDNTYIERPINKKMFKTFVQLDFPGEENGIALRIPYSYIKKLYKQIEKIEK